jgi:hypothetical protein
MMSWEELVRQVFLRAESRCEYCRMHQSLQGATFHVEHIVPCSKGGLTNLDNLALACPTCNLKKLDLTESSDPDSGASVPLFHPRRHSWNEHFRWNGYQLIGLTVQARATIALLDLNHPRRMLIRESEARFGLFP